MTPILMSRNGAYILSENNLYSILEDKTYDLNEISIEKTLDFFKNNSIYLHKNKLMEGIEIIAIHRKIVYQLAETFDNDSKTSIILEFETKFGKLLTESTVLFEGWLSSIYNWTLGPLIDRVKSYGPRAIKFAKDIFTGNVTAMMEDIREILFSPEGMAIEAILTATGIGGFGPLIAWGVMLAYDVVLKAKNDPSSSWMNIFMDAIAVASAGGLAYIGKAIRSTGLIGKTAGKTVEETVAELGKNPQTAKMVQDAGQKVSQKLPAIQNRMKIASDWAAKNLKINWLSKGVDNFTAMIANFLDKIGIKAGNKQLGKALINPNTGRSFRAASKVSAANKGILQKGLKSGVTTGAIAGSLQAAANTNIGRNIIGKAMSLVGANPYDDIIKAADKTDVEFGATF